MYRLECQAKEGKLNIQKAFLLLPIEPHRRFTYPLNFKKEAIFAWNEQETQTFQNMRKQQLSATYHIFDTPDELPSSDQQLLQLATAARQKAHAPYSKFHVGAALLLENGATLTGSNYENAAYPLCVCGEHAALAAAHHQYPGMKVIALAITIKNQQQVVGRPGAPCGGCRQVICETEQKNKQDIRIILRGEVGEIFVFDRGLDLLPLAFDGGFL